MYSASVQIVLAQSRINSLRQAGTLNHHGVSVELYHLQEVPTRMSFRVLQYDHIPSAEAGDNSAELYADLSQHPIVMLDTEKQDLPAKVEAYLRDMLPELIKLEPTHFVQITLHAAVHLANTTNDELLRKALDLWGYVELMDRENQRAMRINLGIDNHRADYISSSDQAFTTIRLQMAAAVERKAASTSKELLLSMQRVLQDSKTKIDFSMYITSMILLHCVEKSTWIFRAWEEPGLRSSWPLSRDPSSFSQQGRGIAEVLRMLLEIRKVLPRTACQEEGGKLITKEENPAIREYFEAIDLDCELCPNMQCPTFSGANVS